MTVTTEVVRLADGFVPLYESVPETFVDAAEGWTRAYIDWLVAGDIPAARTREGILRSGWSAAFALPLPSDFLTAFYLTLVSFWAPGLPIGPTATVGQAGIPALSVVYAPASIPLVNPAAASEDPRELADGLAQFVSSVTLPLVTIQQTAPPFAIVPLTP